MADDHAAREAERDALRSALQFPESTPVRERSRENGQRLASLSQPAVGPRVEGEGVLFMLEIIASATERTASALEALLQRLDALADGREQQGDQRPDS